MADNYYQYTGDGTLLSLITLIKSALRTKADVDDIPTKVSELLNDSKFQTETQVGNAITEALKDITGVKFEIVQALPATGAAGTIYLVPHVHGDKDIYDEYVFVNSKWEKLGSTDIDLSGYVLRSDMHELTAEEVTTIWDSVAD